MKKRYKFGCTILGLMIAFCSIFLLLFYINTNSVYFDTKGGTVYKTLQLRANQKLVKPNDPVMEGYVFVGWYLNNTNEQYDFSKPVTEDITLTAKWQSIIENH